jgi:hypothetical protein
MIAYLINHMRLPGRVHPDVLDYLDRIQATVDPFGGKSSCRVASRRSWREAGPNR